MCIYSFNPYIILEVDINSGVTYKILQARLRYKWLHKCGFLHNSTNLESWDDYHYILFVHDFINFKNVKYRTYMQYGVLISKSTLLPTNIIPYPLVMGGDEPGRHPGVHFTSSLVNRSDGLYAFYGQGDSHTGLLVFNKDKLNYLFERHHVFNTSIY